MKGPAADPELIRAHVRSHYAQAAGRQPTAGSLPMVEEPCCGPAGSSEGARSSSSCCGYGASDLSAVPEGANLGLGCGNPVGGANLRAGEVVLDLGSGAGVDCFIAGDRVGPLGHVIGVDMTPEMVTRARGLVQRAGRANIEFRLGEIEHLPVADASVDVVLSNCVVNLSPDKGAVYREAFRALRPGGRLVIADMVATRPIPPEAQKDLRRWSSCSSGALPPSDVERLLAEAGFVDVHVRLTEPGVKGATERDLGVASGTVQAVKPRLPG